MSSIICALWGLGICGGLLLLMVLVAAFWVEIKSFFVGDK